MDETENIKTIAVNKKARFEYYIHQTFEAGIVLTGTEVKSLRAGRINFVDGYVDIVAGEAWLNGVHISEYAQGNIANHDPVRNRKLLLNKSELRKLGQRVAEKGYTIVPLRAYFKGGKVKIEIGVAQGKKLYDKRSTIQKRDVERDIERTIKN